MSEDQPTSRRPRIAVAGATGRVGSALVSALAEDPVDVIALTRRPEKVSLPKGTVPRQLDFSDPVRLRCALEGTDRLFLSHGTSPDQVSNEIALIDAAVAAGVRYIVKLSVFGPPSRLHPFALHMEIEAHLSKQPVASTVLRPSAYPDILKRSAAQIISGTWGGAAGGGGRVNFIDTRDIAEVARLAVLEFPARDSQRAWHLTGPRALTMEEIANEFTRQLGRNVTYTERTVEEQQALLRSSGSSAFVTDLLLGLDQVFRESVLSETTNTVHRITGHDPRDFTQWLSDNLSSFR